MSAAGSDGADLPAALGAPRPGRCRRRAIATTVRHSASSRTAGMLPIRASSARPASSISGHERTTRKAEAEVLRLDHAKALHVGCRARRTSRSRCGDLGIFEALLDACSRCRSAGACACARSSGGRQHFRRGIAPQLSSSAGLVVDDGLPARPGRKASLPVRCAGMASEPSCFEAYLERNGIELIGLRGRFPRSRENLMAVVEDASADPLALPEDPVPI